MVSEYIAATSMCFKPIRVAIARLLVLTSFVWPFINAAYFFPGATFEINFLPVFLGMLLIPEAFFEDKTSLFLAICAVGIAAVWGPKSSALRLIIGVFPCLFLIPLHGQLLKQGKELIPRRLSYWALVLFVLFSILQYWNFYVSPILPSGLITVLQIVVPRYADTPYDSLGIRGVQGWASEPASAALTCLGFAVVAMQQEPAKKWRILILFSILAAVNKSLYCIGVLFLLGLVCLFTMKKKLYAVLTLIPITAVFFFFVLSSGRIVELRHNFRIQGFDQSSNQELMRVVQIFSPLLSFPRLYDPPILFDVVRMEPLGLLPLLIGYGSIVGCVLYYRVTYRNFRHSNSSSTLLVLMVVLVLSFTSPGDLIPVVVAFAYALMPPLVDQIETMHEFEIGQTVGSDSVPFPGMGIAFRSTIRNAAADIRNRARAISENPIRM